MSKEQSKNVHYYQFKSLFYSYKFFFIQINDICDITTVLALIFLMRKANIGFFATLSDIQFTTYALQSTLECVLELIYTLLMPFMVRRFTVYSNFYPSLAGKDVFFK